MNPSNASSFRQNWLYNECPFANLLMISGRDYPKRNNSCGDGGIEKL